MDWLTFIVSVLKEVTWPIVTVILIWRLKDHLGKLASRLGKLNLPGGVAAEFSQALETARVTTEAVVVAEGLAAPPAAPDQSRIDEPRRIERFVDLAKISPEAAVLEAFKILEAQIISLPQQVKLKLDGLRLNPNGSLRQIIEQIYRQEMIERSWVDLYLKLRSLRNLAAHSNDDRQITIAAALEYQALCRSLSDKLSEVVRTYGDAAKNADAAAPLL
jgi:hypothetical protein